MLLHTHSPLCLCEHHQSQPPCCSTQLHTQAFKRLPQNPAFISPKVNTAFSLWHLLEREDYNGMYKPGTLLYIIALTRKKTGRTVWVCFFSPSKTRFQEISGFVVCTVLNAVMGFSYARRRLYSRGKVGYSTDCSCFSEMMKWKMWDTFTHFIGKHRALSTLSSGSHYQMAYIVLQMCLDSTELIFWCFSSAFCGARKAWILFFIHIKRTFFLKKVFMFCFCFFLNHF